MSKEQEAAEEWAEIKAGIDEDEDRDPLGEWDEYWLPERLSPKNSFLAGISWERFRAAGERVEEMKKEKDDNPKKEDNKFVISHPGTGGSIICDSFEYAMDHWFEGFNIPYKIVDDKLERFSDANKRVQDYFKDKREK